MAYDFKNPKTPSFRCETLDHMPTGTKTRPGVTERAIASILNAARERQGITQAELGAAVGISQSQASRALAGLNPMTMSEMLGMCGALGLVASEVLEQAEREAD